MKKVSKNIALAFKEHQEYRKQNNTICTGDQVWLHYHMLAWRDPDTGVIYLTLAGWSTPTTRERLNAICEVYGRGRPFYQRDGGTYYDGRPIMSDEVIPLMGPLASLAIEQEQK